MAGWHHWLDGRECKQAPGVGDGQGGLACCGSWGCKESDATELEWMTYWEKQNKIQNSKHMSIHKVLPCSVLHFV